MSPVRLTRFAWLSIAASLVVLALKVAAFWVTGSVGLLSDAAESVVNLVAAVIALSMLTLAARPADANHPFGHGKAEYFASGAEGVLILIAAAGIGWAAADRLLHPRPLVSIDVGVLISVVATLINFTVAQVLLRAGRRYRSIALEADAKHLMTDVWTSVGVVVGVGAVGVTGWQPLDPLLALMVAVNIVWSGLGLVSRSLSGLLGERLPRPEHAAIQKVLADYRSRGVQFHDLRTLQSGTQRFMTIHVLIPGETSVRAGHALLEAIEGDIKRALPDIVMCTHLEPLEDLASFAHDRLEVDMGEGTSETAGPFCPKVPESLAAADQSRPGAGTGSRQSAVRPWCIRSGLALLVVGSVMSLVLGSWHADAGLGIALVGFITLLSAELIPSKP